MKLLRKIAVLAVALAAAVLVHGQAYNTYPAGYLFVGTPGAAPQSGYGIPGYTGGVAQVAGAVGEQIQSVVPSGSAVALTTATSANVTTITLTAGEWEVSSEVFIQGTVSTSFTILQGGVGTVTATLPALTSTVPVSFAALVEPAFVPASATIPNSLDPGPVHFSVALGSTQALFLVTNCTFTASTAGAYGFIRALRTR